MSQEHCALLENALNGKRWLHVKQFLKAHIWLTDKVLTNCSSLQVACVVCCGVLHVLYCSVVCCGCVL